MEHLCASEPAQPIPARISGRKDKVFWGLRSNRDSALEQLPDPAREKIQTYKDGLQDRDTPAAHLALAFLAVQSGNLPQTAAADESTFAARTKGKDASPGECSEAGSLGRPAAAQDDERTDGGETGEREAECDRRPRGRGIAGEAGLDTDFEDVTGDKFSQTPAVKIFNPICPQIASIAEDRDSLGDGHHFV